ncbi:dTDP-4-dehydrorhamnose 3,5-epimerase family protein [Cryobacterium aureum]|uniref:dTDP-4-dehydrorhamnose 3,5-epimerase family protein n=1 Tax=Cryobacterium aureum TaxID=995037 RepID=UPI000CF4D0BC|nr:dTDP-4-dehydrorhamnose 3,5-epimerase [Cryobacterium aureum]
MQIRELSIPGSYEVTPRQFGDDRGVFLEWYRFDHLGEAIGHPLKLAQANTSVSKRGVVRGIHFADIPPGQAKHVTVTHGAVLDFVVDLRVGSPAFGTWDSVRLDEQDRRAVYIPEGVGHAFVALTDDATVSYLVTSVFNAGREHGINPLDPDIGLIFPAELGSPLVSEKDELAPSLGEALELGLLPTWEASQAFYASLNTESN